MVSLERKADATDMKLLLLEILLQMPAFLASSDGWSRHSQQQRQRTNSLSAATLHGAALSSVRSSGPPRSAGDLRVTDFGADPTGRADSSAAFSKALSVAASEPSLVTVNLGGGHYRLDSPRWAPERGRPRLETGDGPRVPHARGRARRRDALERRARPRARARPRLRVANRVRPRAVRSGELVFCAKFRGTRHFCPMCPPRVLSSQAPCNFD